MNELALYNEIDDFAADWLENLIRADLIAPGRVDRRSIVDLTPDDLAGYRQVHLFAGIGIWSAALRDAGQRDDAPWWTASCPCQPFSAAGKGNGFADERHLWPAVFHLASECRPSRIIGEQVASPDGLHWLDLVSSDMEAAGYAFGASDLCAPGIQVPAGETTIGRETIEWIRGAILTCPDPQLAADLRDYAEWFEREVGIGAPHIRQRLFWVADSDSRQRDGIASGEGSECDGTQARRQQGDGKFKRRGEVGTTAHSDGRDASAEGLQRSGKHGQQPQDGSAGELADSPSDGRREERQDAGRIAAGDRTQGRPAGLVPSGATDIVGHAHNAGSQGRVECRNSRDERSLGASGLAFFSECDWIVCTDGQARPTQPGLFPLVDGPIPDLVRKCADGSLEAPSRIGLLRCFGNAIVRPLAAEFIRAAEASIEDLRTMQDRKGG